MKEDRAEKLKALMEDPAFADGLARQVQPEDAQTYLAAHGLQFTVEELKALQRIGKLKAGQKPGDELTEEELAQVAGGVMGWDDMIIITWVAVVGILGFDTSLLFW